MHCCGKLSSEFPPACLTFPNFWPKHPFSPDWKRSPQNSRFAKPSGNPASWSVSWFCNAQADEKSDRFADLTGSLNAIQGQHWTTSIPGFSSCGLMSDCKQPFPMHWLAALRRERQILHGPQSHTHPNPPNLHHAHWHFECQKLALVAVKADLVLSCETDNPETCVGRGLWHLGNSPEAY